MMDYHENTAMGETKTTKFTDTTGKWLGWIGIVAGVIAFFYMPYWLGAAAVILGIFGIFSPQRNLNIVSIVIGAAAILMQFIR